jgi:lysyl-tRNA synthetase class 2
MVDNIRLLTKALRPIPRQLEDKEQIFRRRYLDLVVNEDHFEMFKRKAQFWQVQRDFLREEGFMEVEVPILEPVTGGADATPFTTHHNALDQDFYLRISTELYQKRLIGAGYEKIYTFGPHFRNEGLSEEHLQEFYDIEWYWAYANFRDNMELVKKLFLKIANEIYGKTEFTTRGHTFDLADDWGEIDYTKAIKDRYAVDIFEDDIEDIKKVVKSENLDVDPDANKNRLIDTLWKNIRKDISGPAFLINQPKFLSPLAKSYDNREEITERFQVIIAGSELGNGYSEINNPLDQLDRFLEQQRLREEGDEEAQMLDIDFVEMLEYGMPPASGYGQSERIFWFLEDVTAREGTFFPQLKPEIDNITRKVYSDKVKFPKR